MDVDINFKFRVVTEIRVIDLLKLRFLGMGILREVFEHQKVALEETVRASVVRAMDECGIVNIKEVGDKPREVLQ